MKKEFSYNGRMRYYEDMTDEEYNSIITKIN